MTRMIVCGPRVGIKTRHVFQVLDAVAQVLPEPTRIEIVEGTAACVDQAAGAWADRKAHAHWRFPINNDLDGEDPMTAPKRRNTRMRDSSKATHCLGFPGHGGTNHMMDISKQAGMLVWEVEFNDDGGQSPTEFCVRQWGQNGARSTLICSGPLS